MRRTSFLVSCQVFAQLTYNWMARRPLVVSFEVTNSCTCWCRHCDHGGPADAARLMPADIRHWMKVLHPGVIQISGGEPLMRDDIVDCVRAAQQFGGMPYTMLVSNFSEMTSEKYLALKNAGIDQFSVSLDFPDDRHDGFRGHPGLYDHLQQLLPELSAYGFDDVVINTAMHSENYLYVNEIADQAEEWGVNASFSAYSPKRTGDHSLSISSPEQLAGLRTQLDRLQARKRAAPKGTIVTDCTTLEEMYRYFTQGGLANCSAGLKFLVVNADGELQPCSMQFCKFSDQRTMVEEFTEHNDCDECYVLIRSNLDKTYSQLAMQNTRDFFSLGRAQKAT